MAQSNQNQDPTLLREWMVRTQSGEVIGPFNQKELLDALHQNRFRLEDEICPSMGSWVSAQVLSFRESDELTKTSTRTHQTATTAESEIITDSSPAYIAPSPLPEKLKHFETQKPPKHWSSNFSVSTYILLALVVGASIAVSFRLRQEPNASPTQTDYDKGILVTDSPLLRDVYKKIHQGKNKEALKVLTQYHERGPAKNDIEYIIPYAALLIMESDATNRAVKLLQHVVESPATLELKAKAHHWLGYALLSGSDGDMGESHFLEALQLNPKDPAARFNLGRAYLKQEKYSQALDYLQLAELENPNLWLVHIYKGRARFALQQIEEAKASFKTAIATSPDRWLTYIYYSLFLKQSNQRAAAQQTLKVMLRQDPMYELHSPAPWGYFQEKTDYGEYLEVFNSVMSDAMGPEKEIGRLYLQYLAALKDTGRRLEILAEKPDVFGKVLGLKVLIDREASAQEIKKALEKFPVNLSDFGYYGYVLRAEAWSRVGQDANAKQDLEKALEMAPQSAVAEWAYASLLRRQGAKEAADRQLQTLLSYHPNYIPAIVAAPGE